MTTDPMPSSQATSARSGYQRSWTRMLVDLEIPAWNDAFLTEFDPEHMADLYVAAGARGVMLPCKNLSGWLFWQMPDGPVHPRIGRRDIVAETTAAAASRNLNVCAYFAAVYDNQPFHRHPDWRYVPAQGMARTDTVHDRHGLCCPNSEGYRSYLKKQISDLFMRYEFSCAFVDMTFWPGVCVCHNCRTRLLETDGIEIPEVVDWTSPKWTLFQHRREQWIVEFQTFITQSIKETSCKTSVYHNFGPAAGDWHRSIPFDTTSAQDFLGGDLYGDETEQLLVMKLMRNLSSTQPVEYMTFGTHSYSNHVDMKSSEDLKEHVLSAAAERVASLFIEAVDPVGTVNDASYTEIGRALRARHNIDPEQPEIAVEDVALYFSSDSKFSFSSQQVPLESVGSFGETYPHIDAMRGAVRSLQRDHIQFGVITRKQLDELGEYKVIVLPNVHRMTHDEVKAIRKYVQDGGRLYASGYSSLLRSDGELQSDFMLSDLYGVSLRDEIEGQVAYLGIEDEALKRAATPQRFLSHWFSHETLRGGIFRLDLGEGAERLAELVLPFANPAPGSYRSEDWASIHTMPPWEYTGDPCLIRHQYGAGECVYSSIPFEVGRSFAAERVFSSIIRSLCGDDQLITIDADSHIRSSAFMAKDRRTIRIILLNYPVRWSSVDAVIHVNGRRIKRVEGVKETKPGATVRRGGEDGDAVRITGEFEYIEITISLDK